MVGGLVRSLSLSSALLFGLLLGWLLWIRAEGSESAEVQRVGEVYDGRLQFMAGADALRLVEALLVGDVTPAWTVWSEAAEAALADALIDLLEVLFLLRVWFRGEVAYGFENLGWVGLR